MKQKAWLLRQIDAAIAGSIGDGDFDFKIIQDPATYYQATRRNKLVPIELTPAREKYVFAVPGTNVVYRICASSLESFRKKILKSTIFNREII